MPDAATLSIAGLGGLTLALAMRMSAINVEQMQLARAAADPKRAAARFLQGALHVPSLSCPSVPLSLCSSRLSHVSPFALSLSRVRSPCLPVSLSLILSFSSRFPFRISIARSVYCTLYLWWGASRARCLLVQRHVLQVVEPGATEQCRVRPNARRPHATDQVQGRAPRAYTHHW